MRRPGQPASGRSRFGVPLWPATRASASSLASVALAVFRRDGCDAAVLDGGQVGCGCREESRREDATSLQSQRKSTCHRSSARVSIGETDSHHARERPVTSSATASMGPSSRANPGLQTVVLTRSTIPSIRCPNRVMHRRVPWRGVPLPDGSSLRGLAGRVILPSARPAALMGFFTLRRFAPADG
jgi:hypothetical protein